MTEYTALREEDGRTYIVPIQDDELKVKGIGRFAPKPLLEGIQNGERVTIGQKVLTRVEVGLPELRKGMKRRAQIINPKDAGFLIAWMGIGVGQRVLEAGHGSGGLALHIANVLGGSGTLVSVENRPEHAEVGRERGGGAHQPFKNHIPLANHMDIRPILNVGRLIIIFLFILFVVFSRTSMLRDNPLSGILG